MLIIRVYLGAECEPEHMLYMCTSYHVVLQGTGRATAQYLQQNGSEKRYHRQDLALLKLQRLQDLPLLLSVKTQRGPAALDMGARPHLRLLPERCPRDRAASNAARQVRGMGWMAQ